MWCATSYAQVTLSAELGSHLLLHLIARAKNDELDSHWCDVRYREV